MTSKEKQNENLYEWISAILGQISNGYPLQRSSKRHPSTFKIVRHLCATKTFLF
jgi:type II secretory pathway component PulF